MGDTITTKGCTFQPHLFSRVVCLTRPRMDAIEGKDPLTKATQSAGGLSPFHDSGYYPCLFITLGSSLWLASLAIFRTAEKIPSRGRKAGQGQAGTGIWAVAAAGHGRGKSTAPFNNFSPRSLAQMPEFTTGTSTLQGILTTSLSLCLSPEALKAMTASCLCGQAA